MHGTHTNINLLVTDDWGRSLLAAGCFLRFGASRVQPCSLVLSQHALSVKYTTIFSADVELPVEFQNAPLHELQTTVIRSWFVKLDEGRYVPLRFYPFWQINDNHS